MGKKVSVLIIVFVIAFALMPVFLVILRQRNKLEMNKPGSSSLVRPAAVAGSFYPADRETLNQKIQACLDKVQKVAEAENVKILIVPHAGLEYSGLTAAWGFKQLENSEYSKVIILGSSHRHWFDQAAVYAHGSWKTPLGEVIVDEEHAAKIINGKTIIDNPQPHADEHSLEVELIFLQKVLSSFKIIPILLSNTDDQVVEDLAQKIASVFDTFDGAKRRSVSTLSKVEWVDDTTLLVVSSDFSHYPSYEIANDVDKATIESILTGSRTSFEERFKKSEEAGLPGLETPACANQAIRVALRVGEILKIDKYQLLKYENSGDIPAGEKNRVVGYAAIAGWNHKKQAPDRPINSEAQKEALTLARNTLREYLSSGKIPKIEVQNVDLESKRGAFVTLRKDDQLRGCIGTFEPKESLAEVVQKMAVAAAVQDYRFSPVSLTELDQINIEISVLTTRQKVSDWKTIRLGIDGVVVESAGKSGTFLPQVAAETGWSLEQFLTELCVQKAGLPPDCYKDSKTDIYVFQAQVFEEERG